MNDDGLIYSLAFDPGSTHAGASYIVFDMVEKKVLSLETKHLKMSSGINKRLADMYGALFARIQLLKTHVNSFIEDKKITSASTEGVFFNVKRPNAAIPIATSIFTITEILYDKIPGIPLVWVPASLVKTAVYAKGNCGKEPIKEGVIKSLKEFSYETTLEGCTEHEIDSVAVNIARIRVLIDKEKK